MELSISELITLLEQQRNAGHTKVAFLDAIECELVSIARVKYDKENDTVILEE